MKYHAHQQKMFFANMAAKIAAMWGGSKAHESTDRNFYYIAEMPVETVTFAYILDFRVSSKEYKTWLNLVEEYRDTAPN